MSAFIATTSPAFKMIGPSEYQEAIFEVVVFST